MQPFSTHTYQLTQTHHLGIPLAVYLASVGRSNLIYLLIGAGLIAVPRLGMVVMKLFPEEQWRGQR